jgi:hypothetical protein
VKTNYCFSPIAFKVQWTKKKIIEVYNTSNIETAKSNPYSTKTLSNKTVKRIISDIATLVVAHNKAIKQMGGSTNVE